MSIELGLAVGATSAVGAGAGGSVGVGAKLVVVGGGAGGGQGMISWLVMHWSRKPDICWCNRI